MKTDSSNLFLLNHTSVMSNEIVNSIDNCPLISSQEFFGIDATLGGGGHSKKLLEKYPNLSIIGLDQDPFAREAARINLREYKNRIQIKGLNFADFRPTNRVSFVIADLGISSYQIDNPERGFSFMQDGPLDMRMNPNLDNSAKDLIENLPETDLANLIYKYGEERYSRKIARKIKNDLKEKGSYSGTKDLAYSIAGCFPPKHRYRRIHPATKTFQALRIAVNKEIEVLESLLNLAPRWILPQGILAIISFHSLEDRKVKNHFKNNESLVNLTKKPLTPMEEEINSNKRCRSAKLRIAQKR